MKKFVCTLCGYIHIGEEPPEYCPICDAPPELFELLSEEEPKDSIHQQKQEEKKATSNKDIGKVIILGTGIASLSAAESIRETSPEASITMISNERTLPYYRLNLTKFLAGEVKEADLNIHPQQWYEANKIELILDEVITDIDRVYKRIETMNGLKLSYDQLVIGLGAHPFIPPIEGISQEGIYSVRTIEDAKELQEAIEKDTRVLVLGGGVLGLETASAIQQQGGNVTVAEGAPWLMPVQLNEKAAAYIVSNLSEQNIDVKCNFMTARIEKSENRFFVYGKDGDKIECDIIVVATGVRPNTYLARKAGLNVDKGIVVDNYMKTSDASIYAVGDIAEHLGVVYGLWGPASYQGKIGGMNLAGKDTEFGGIPRSNVLKVLDIDVFSIGEHTKADGSYTMLEKAEKDRYLMFMIKDGMLVGSIAIGHGHIVHKIKSAVESKLHLDKESQDDLNLILEAIG